MHTSTTSSVTKSQSRSVVHSNNSHSAAVVTNVTMNKSVSLSSPDEMEENNRTSASVVDTREDHVAGEVEIGPIRSTETRSFLNTSDSKVTGFRDVMERMQNADNGI